MGKSKLVEYGIKKEESDYRIHVSFFTGTAYRFPTEEAKAIVKDCQAGKKRFETFMASQPGTTEITGIGYKIPHKAIPGCVEIKIPDEYLLAVNFDPEWTKNFRDNHFYHRSTSAKGRAAETITRMLLENQMIPLPLESKFIENKHIQQEGKDFFVKAEIWIEAKCDAWGGRTGLRLQTHESNPFKRF